jgi:flagellar motor switch protein FliG
MTNVRTNNLQHRVGVLLQILGPEVSQTVLSTIPTEKRKQLKSQIDELSSRPPSKREVLDILQEFDRLLTFATPAAATVAEEETNVTISGKQTPLDLPDDPFEALGKISNARLVAALRDETPRTIALVLNCLTDTKAAQILNELPAAGRDGAILQLKEKLTPPLELLTRLIRATVDKCASFVEQELEAELASSDERLARLLRTMDSVRRGEVLQMLEESDAEACDRIRGSLFGFDDLLGVEQKTLQRILGEIDTRTLAVALKSADEPLQDRVLTNLSKRAREGLSEEIDLLGNVQAAEIETAQSTIVKAMIELDRIGELLMEES